MSIGSIGDGRRKRYADTRATAEYMNCSAAYLEKARVTGLPQIPFIKLGRKVLYDLDIIDQLLADRARVSTSARAAS
jgi:hypothetical protein